ncbi:MAG: Hint domain-containing protein [Proteobacteria bacterium]|nr:Hint domain-containing protein [Pseudomonadota bacterium]
MKMNRSGNTLVTVLVVSTLILGGVVISMQYVGLTNTSSINALKNSLAGADDLTALNILSGKLTMGDASEWGVEPYPIGEELASPTFKPYIKNFFTGTVSLVPNLRAEGVITPPSASCNPRGVPLDKLPTEPLDSAKECNLTHFDLDASRLGSLERGGDIGGWSEALSTRSQTELQKGFVGYPKPSQLSEVKLKEFLSGKTPLFPEDGIKAKAVTFYKLGFDPSEPRILSSLEVSVGDTRAIIPFPAPPDPTCKITIEGRGASNSVINFPSVGASPLPSEDLVTVKLYVDSIVGAFQLTLDSFRTFFPSVASLDRQSIQTIRKFSPTFPTEVPTRMPLYQKKDLKPPTDLYSLQGPRIWQGNDDGHGTWTVQGWVENLKRDPKTAPCQIDVQVYPPPKPHCTVSVAKRDLLKGESTDVTLDCSYPDSGRVDSARFTTGDGNSFPVDSFAPNRLGTSGYKKATARYTRTTDYLHEPIHIAVTGPGGTTVLYDYLDEVCNHNDPNFVSYIQREWLPTAPLRRNYGYIDGWRVCEAGSVANDKNDNIGNWDSRRQTTDTANYFNMESFQIQYSQAYPNQNASYTVNYLDGKGVWQSYQVPYVIDNSWINKVENNIWIKPGGIEYWVEVGPKRSRSCTVTQYWLRRQGCFTSDTRIRMADGREKLVSKISENDLIWNPLYQSPVKVIKVVKGPEKKALYQLRVAKNRLVVTEDHPFLTQRGWVRADELDTKDLIMGEGLGKQILSVKKLSYKKPVFNFELDTDIAEGHMVIANGIPTGDLTTQVAIKQNRKNLP